MEKTYTFLITSHVSKLAWPLRRERTLLQAIWSIVHATHCQSIQGSCIARRYAGWYASLLLLVLALAGPFQAQGRTNLAVSNPAPAAFDPPVITLSTNAKNLLLQPSTNNSFSINVGTSDGSVTVISQKASYNPNAAPWLTFNASGKTGTQIVFFYNSNQLVVGTYYATVNFTAAGYTKATLTIKLDVSNESSIIPKVISTNPATGSTNVDLTTNISTDALVLPPGGIDNTTISTSTVKLFQIEDTQEIAIAGLVNGTGGGDAITFNPMVNLAANTFYRFVITDGVKALNGTAFAPYEGTFKTGAGTVDNNPLQVGFEKIPMKGTQFQRYTSLAIGPDHKLYGLLLNGQIRRFAINPDGTLGPAFVINTLRNQYSSELNTNGNRSAVGLVFDPASTESHPIVYISHCSPGLSSAPEFDGNISKLTGSNLENHQLLITRLPRSRKDHLVNSLAFGPDGAMYFNQGGNTGTGAYDTNWQREESLLSGANLRLDLDKLTGIPLPLNVETSNNLYIINNAPSDSYRMPDVGTQFPQGSYNPYASNSPLTIYASGVRNAFDLVWHSNGQLYLPINGTGQGGSTPGSVAGTRRPDGTFYNGPNVPSTAGVPTQHDLLFRVDPALPVGYFGHPNGMRGEYVLNRGYLDAPKYGSVAADSRYRGAVYDFGFNKSPNGAIEYKSNTFNGALKGKLLVCRFSGSSDIMVLPINPATKDIDLPNVKAGSDTPGVAGMSGFANPLDIVEDLSTGNLYVAEHDWNGNGTRAQITLLKVTPVCLSSGVILREHWANVGGNLVSAIPLNKPPTSVSQLALLEAPADAAENFGARIRGSICAPSTGNYTFWISSNNDSELWLSTDNNPDNKRKIAYLTGPTTLPREWSKYASQKSAAISLKAGYRYYIEVLHKESYGADHVAVGWQLPDSTYERPIPGSRLSPFDIGDNPAPAPGNFQAVAVSPSQITLSWTDVANEASYVLERATTLGGTYTVVATLAANTTSYTNTGLTAATTYYYRIKSVNASGDSPYSAVDSATTSNSTCSASGTIRREVWANVGGNAISTIPVNQAPSSVSQLSLLEAPADAAENFGARIRGYVCVPQSGNYTFWISGNNDCALYLSSDESAANKQSIAFITGPTTLPREWSKYASQQSNPIALIAGKRYYIEVLHKESYGADHVAVGWQLPNGSYERPIPGNRLSPFVPMTTLALVEREESTHMEAYPNPVSGDMTVRFRVANSGPVSLSVFDSQGRELSSLFSGILEAGKEQLVTLDATKLPEGLFILKLVEKERIHYTKVIHNR